MAFAPANNIFLRHVPFDNSYTHVFDFSDVNAQKNYFDSLGGFNLSNFTYQRKDSIIRVPLNAEALYNINYVFYQNSEFGTKWFYAFVTKIEYVNDNTSFLYIETDVWQTWLFDWYTNECFVERMHVPYDTEGEWTEPEPINAESYPRSASRLTPQIDIFSQGIILYFSKPPGAISGAGETPEDSGALSATWSKKYLAGGGGLPAFQDCMSDLDALEQAGEMELISGIGICFGAPAAGGETTIDFVELPPGGVAKNNKTLMWCYALIVGNATYKVDIGNCHGRTFNYIPRVCEGQSPFCSVELTNLPHVVIDYSGFPSPRLPINSDVNQISREIEISLKTLPYTAINAGIGAAATVAGGGTPSLGGIFSPIQNLISTYGRTAVSDIMPKQLSGFSPSTAMYSAGQAGVYLIKYCPNREEFNKIDNFFSAFGYAINDVRQPIFRIGHSGRRANFNYIKTSGAAVIATGGIAQEDFPRIAKILDAGVTVWHNPGAYGDLTIANDPV